MGKKIDSFPLVARFNTFHIRGYEKYVGTKTNIWITCLDRRIPDECKHYDLVLHVKSGFVLDRNYRNLCDRFVNVASIGYLETTMEVERIMKWSHPSSGAMASMYFVQRMYKVYLYGFDHFEAEKHHYGDDEEIGRKHRADLEKLYFDYMMREGYVEYF